MADKEATVFILDLGSSMSRTHDGRDESDLDWSMRYVWDKITDIVASNRKTLCVGVVGLRTDDTNNKLMEDDGYENISVLQDLGPMTMASLRGLQAAVKPSKTLSGDAISAIVVAVDMIDTFTKKLKWTRKIVLVTDGQGPVDSDGLGDIAKKMNDSNIQLTVLGVDFDDAEYGYKEEDKSHTKAENEQIFRSLVEECKDGVFASIVEAIDDLDTPRAKSIKPYKTYDGPITLGDPETFPAAMSINVERYFKTHLARPMTATTVVMKSEQGVGSQSTQTIEDDEMEGVEFAAVKQARTYKVNDADAPGGKRDVEFESLSKGYEYGRTAVHISESEYNITKLETLKSFSIVGFIPQDRYEPFLNMGEACVTHARRYDTKSELALSSLIWALSELESYAVARIVTKEGKDPQLLLLAPSLDPELECLYDVPLPFAEDIRSYQFPPLDKVVTVSGQTLTKHRLLPSDELSEAMSDYVDSMDLSTYGIDAEGEPAEYVAIDDTYNPTIHRINHAVKTRAVYPEKPVPPTPAILLRFAAPPQDLIEKVQSRVDSLIAAAEVKKVPPKVKGKRKRETVKPISGLDVDALLGDKEEKISPENAIPDFKRILSSSEEVSDIEEAVKQLGNIVRSLVSESFGDSKYDRAMECIGVMREELTNLEEPGLYNTFVRDLKKKLLSGALGGDRRDFWFRIRSSKLGLVDEKQSEVSDVKAQEAEEHLLGRSVSLQEPLPQQLEGEDGTSMANGSDTTIEPLAEWSKVAPESIVAPNSAAPLSPLEDLAEDVLDYATFRAGDTIDADVTFCPWNLVMGYPSHYIGKTNKPLAQPFFDKILEGRVWDFFYLHDVANPLDRPALLVPTVQFEDFLRFVNRQLNISLRIPGGVNQNKFTLKFGDGNTPRPRYLQRSRDAKTLQIENWPMMSDEDALAFKDGLARFQKQWTNTFKLIPTSVVFGKTLDSKRKAIRKAEHRAEMLKETQQLLGICKEGITEDAVFVCFDVEAIERSPHPISEVGIAILDVESIKNKKSGQYGEHWWPEMQAHHLRVKEYSGLVNREFVHGCPDAFDFGISTFPSKAEVAEAILAILSQHIDTKRPLVIVGHDVKQDVQYLSEMGIEITKLAGLRAVIDSQALHQAWRATDSQRSLLAVLGDLGMSSQHLHNAGNDAVYTLRATIGIAVRQSREQLIEGPDLSRESPLKAKLCGQEGY
ncbi:ATP-dependent DNA helicase II subunit [Paramyrothecium foliicola]|nr:ATP-dependent DNA helicase II subunit [Paramyrothecium foliicola]